MRVDTTVVETNIHYHRQQLLGDGVRVLTRTMKKITGIAGAAGTNCAIAAAASNGGCWRSRGRPRQRSTKRREAGAGLPQITGGNRPGGGTGKTLRHGDRRRRQAGGDTRRQVMLEGLRRELESMVPRVRQVMRQTNARVFAGEPCREQDCQLFEPSTEVIRKGKAGKPPNSAKWSNCRRRRTDRIATKSTIDGPSS